MIKITKEDRQLQHACADPRDGKRYNIHGVHFNEKFAVATDGRGLAIKKKTSTVDDKTIQFSTPYSKGDTEYTESDEGKALLSINAGRKCDTAEILEERFPNYKRVIQEAKEKKTKFRIKLNAEVLLNLARALADKKYKEKSMYVEIDIPEGDGEDSFVIKGSGPGIGIIMPVFGGEPTPSPREILARMTTEDPFLNFVDDELEGKHATEE